MLANNKGRIVNLVMLFILATQPSPSLALSRNDVREIKSRVMNCGDPNAREHFAYLEKLGVFKDGDLDLANECLRGLDGCLAAAENSYRAVMQFTTLGNAGGVASHRKLLADSLRLARGNLERLGELTRDRSMDEPGWGPVLAKKMMFAERIRMLSSM